jgi:hypothetical protein
MREFTEAMLTGITARQRAMLKLQFGCLPLNNDELGWVLPERRGDAVEVRSRTLEEVAGLIGLTRERVRQVNSRSLRKLGLNEGGTDQGNLEV